MEQIKVLIVDDHPVVRQGLRAMLAPEEFIEVVGEAADGVEAVEMVGRLEPQVVLMDIRLPRLDGLEATRRIKAEHSGTAVVMLTMYEGNAYVTDAVRAGAEGYLLKDATQSLLVHTIWAASSGGTLAKTDLLRGALATTAAAPGGRSSRGFNPTEALTPRELEVLRLVGDGLTNKEIGARLSISDETAKRHVQNIIGKLQALDRTHAATIAARAGLLDTPDPIGGRHEDFPRDHEPP